MITNEKFFDQVSGFYDEMISFDASLVNRRKALSHFIIPEMKTAADLGCGSGLDSISMALNGLNVTSFDISQGMLESAKEKSKQLALEIDYHKYSLTDIPGNFDNSFDFALSLGNTLANLKDDALKQAIKRAYAILKQGGTFLLQVLNYTPIAAKGERILNITRGGGKYFIRFYDFHENTLGFNILTFEKEDPLKRSLATTMLYPHNHEVLSGLLKEAGFSKINFYGNLNKSDFNKDTSSDIIIAAFK